MFKIKRHSVDRNIKSDLFAFFKSIFNGHKRQVLCVSLLSFLTACSQIAFGFFLFKLVTGGEITLLGWTVETSLVPMIIAGLALASAIIPFITQRYIVKSTTDYLALNVKWFRTALSNTHTRYYILSMGLPRSTLTRLMSSEIRYASLSYASVLRFVLPAILGLACIILLFTININWSIVLCILVLPFLAVGAHIISSGMTRNEELRDSAQSHSKAAASLVTQVISHFSANRWGDKMAEENLNSYDYTYVQAYRRRLHLGINIKFTMDFLTFSIIGVLGLLILSGKLDLEGITYVLVYGIVLRFALGYLTSCLNHSITIVSQLPYYSNYIKVRASVERDIIGSSSNIAIDSLVPKAAVDNLSKVVGYNLEIGRVNLIHPEGAGWISAAEYLKQRMPEVETSQLLRGAILLSGNYPILFDDFQATFQMSPKVTLKTLLKSFPESSHREAELATITELPFESFNKDIFAKIAPPAKFLISVNYALRKGLSNRIVFLSAQDYLRLSDSEKLWMDKLLASSHVVFVGINRKIFRNQDDEVPTYEVIEQRLLGPFPLRTADTDNNE